MSKSTRGHALSQLENLSPTHGLVIGRAPYPSRHPFSVSSLISLVCTALLPLAMIRIGWQVNTSLEMTAVLHLILAFVHLLLSVLAMTMILQARSMHLNARMSLVGIAVGVSSLPLIVQAIIAVNGQLSEVRGYGFGQAIQACLLLYLLQLVGMICWPLSQSPLNRGLLPKAALGALVATTLLSTWWCSTQAELGVWLPILGILLLVYVSFLCYRRLFQEYPCHFTAALTLSIIPLLVAQVHLLLAGEPLSGPHIFAARILLLLSVFLPMLGAMSDQSQRIGQWIERRSRMRAVQTSLEAQIEERTQIQDELESQRNLLEVTLSAIGEGIVTTDTGGRINFMNPVAEELTSWKLPEVCLCKLNQIFRLWDLDYQRELHKPLDSLLHEGMPITDVPRHALLQAKDGELVPIEYSGSPILSKDNQLIGSVVVFHDISEQRRVARELSEAHDKAVAASNSKSEFLASVSHEIRTPMNAILGMVDLLMETELTTEQQKYLKTFKGASESLLLLINDILDVSVMESGHIHLETIPFDLRDLIEVQVNLFRLESERKGLILDFKISSEVPNLLVGDPGRLGQILFNLVGNAIKFTHEGSVTILVNSSPDGYIHFSVSDTGIGISRDKQNKIFDIFTQADASMTREYGGTGLGLAICRNLIHQMGGHIWVESEIRKGSTFHFTMRLELGDPEHLERMTQSEEESNQQELECDDRPLSILLVEDSPDNRLLINFYLKNTPYQITEAENGSLAVEAFRKNQGCFDLILMDIQMPVMDGYTATRRIRSLEKEMDWEPSAITALTASVLDESIYKSYEAGCDAHLKKPIKKDTLLKAILEHTANRPLKQGLEHESAQDYKRAVETELADLIPTYLENRTKDLETLQQALRDCDFDTMRLLGHRMKGSGAGYGFSMITKIGAALEADARQRDLPALSATINRLSIYLERLSEFKDSQSGN